MECQELLRLLSHSELYEYKGKLYLCINESHVGVVGVNVNKLSKDAETLRLWCWQWLGCLDAESINLVAEFERQPAINLLCIREDDVYSLVLDECVKTEIVFNVEDVNRSSGFLHILKALFFSNISKERDFKEILYKLLIRSLPNCRVYRERYVIYDKTRVDILVECDEYVVGIDIKTPQDLCDTPSKSTCFQVKETLKDLLKYGKNEGKNVALVLIRTDGGPIPYIYGCGEKGRVHLISKINIDRIMGFCRVNKCDDVYTLLKALASSKINTIHIEKRGLVRRY